MSRASLLCREFGAHDLEPPKNAKLWHIIYQTPNGCEAGEVTMNLERD